MPNTAGIIEGFEAGGELLPVVVIKIIGARADGDEEVIVFDGTGVAELDLTLVRVDIDGLVEENMNIVLIAEDGADRLGDFGGGETGGGDLVKQRLEQVVVLAVYDGDPDVVATFEGAAKFEAAEACAEDDNVGWVSLGIHNCEYGGKCGLVQLMGLWGRRGGFSGQKAG